MIQNVMCCNICVQSHDCHILSYTGGAFLKFHDLNNLMRANSMQTYYSSGGPLSACSGKWSVSQPLNNSVSSQTSIGNGMAWPVVLTQPITVIWLLLLDVLHCIPDLPVASASYNHWCTTILWHTCLCYM